MADDGGLIFAGEGLNLNLSSIYSIAMGDGKAEGLTVISRMSECKA